MNELRGQRVWLVWAKKSEPTSALTGKRNNWQNNLSTFTEALEFCRQNSGYRIGVMFNKDCGFIGLDYDSAMQGGQPTRWAEVDYHGLKSKGMFLEPSVSGTGFKTIIQCGVPVQRCTVLMEGETPTGRHDPQIEVYTSKYFALTTDPEELSHVDTSSWSEVDVISYGKHLGRDLIRNDSDKSDNQSGGVEPERLAKALSYIDINGFKDRDSWMRMMAISHHSTGGSDDGLDAFCEWSSGDDEKYDEGYTRYQWGTLRGDHENPATFASLVKMLTPEQKAEFYGKVSASDEFVAVEEAPLPIGLGVNDSHNIRWCADQFVSQHRDRVMYCPDNNRWYVYDGQRWCDGGEGYVKGYLYNFLSRDSLMQFVPMSLFGDMRSKAVMFVDKMQGGTIFSKMWGNIKHCPEFHVGLEDINQNPMLFNTDSGTLNLESGKLQPHSPSDYLTQVSGTSVIDGARCPTWKKFLVDIFGGDVDLIRYVKQLTGYALMGKNSEEVFPIAYGFGCNGKSTFTKVVQLVFGDYSTTVTSDLLSKSKTLHPTHMAQLYGNRFALLTEMEGELTLSESMVKQISATDTMTARYMRGDPWEFEPSHLAWISTNHMPEVRGNDNGIWRRLKLIPFNVDLSSRRDVEMVNKLSEELPGILSWMMDGLRDYQKNGFVEPVSVSSATEDYKLDEDDFAVWLNENTITCEGEDCFVQVKELHTRYSMSFPKNLNFRKFCRLLRANGLMVERSKSGGVRDEMVIYGRKLISNMASEF